MTIETKFNVGDVVTYIGEYSICTGTITRINIIIGVLEQPSIIYEVGKKSLSETRCFSSLKDLIKHLETSGS